MKRRLAAWILCLVMVLSGLTACTQTSGKTPEDTEGSAGTTEAAAIETVESEPQTEGTEAVKETSGSGAAAMSYTPGTYSATAIGHGGNIVLEVTFSESEILSVEILEQQETIGFGDAAVEKLPGLIVENQSLGIDGVSGATESSSAIFAAVEDCVKQAGGDVELLKVKVEKQAGETENYDCDVCVIGGGASGTLAAIQASELGAKVILLEKTDFTRCGGDGFLVADSYQFEQVGIEPMDVEEFFTAWMNDTSWGADANLVRQWITASTGTVDMLEKYGCDLEKALVVYSGRDAYADFNGFTQFNTAERTTAAQLADALASIEDNGGMVMTATEATAFLLNDAGLIEGVQAFRADGTEVLIHCASVVNAAGGYTGDAEWMGESWDGITPRGAQMKTNTGNVIKLCLELGASTRGQAAIMARSTNLEGDFTAWTEPSGDGLMTEGVRMKQAISKLACVMFVNKQGYRYCDEDACTQNRTYNGMAVQQQGGEAYVAITENMLRILGEQGSGALGQVIPQGGGYNPDYTLEDQGWGPHMVEIADSLVEQGVAFKGDTVEELAQNAGIDPQILQETYDTYNAACEAGYDDLFYKDSYLLYPQDEGPYYLLKHDISVLTTLGGLRVNTHMEVLSYDAASRDFTAIPNLYAAGTATGGIYGDHYAHAEGPCLSYCMASGRIAGIYAVNNALGTEYDWASIVPGEAYRK